LGAGSFTTLSATGVATFSAGTAALPAITTTGDTNTGIFFPAADTLAFSEGGAEAMRIDSSGNVGIGTSSPSTYGKFTVVSGAVAQDTVDVNSFAQIRHSLGGSGVGGSSTQWYADNTPSFVGAIGTAVPGSGANSALVFSTYSGSWAERMRINSSGDLYVGGTTALGGFGAENVTEFYYAGYCAINSATANAPLYLARTSSVPTGGLINFGSNGSSVGSISYNGTLTAYNTTSDYRLKTVVGAVTDAGHRIDALKPVEYTWNSNGQQARGFLAHQFQEVYAASVTGTKDAMDADGKPAYQSMQAGTAEVIADLVAEIQSLRKRLTALEST
jgi:hypothetical protein